ncbi:MAG: S-layer homology domain-containing protein [Candidatus Saganbacteria bacterium]|nr:S-layer homology domain-containing protein [Candidatus Saganbacteria bacterium]
MRDLYFNLKLITILSLLIFVFATATFAVVDPMYGAVGARALGMGKAYVGFAENAEAMFVNPAGLGQQYGLKLTSMQASLMKEINYLVVGGSHSIKEGQSLGVGYVSLGTTGIELRDDDGNLSGSGDYNSAVYFLSYGMQPHQLFSKLPENLFLGSNIKYFSKVLSGSAEMQEGSGSGFDLDLALLYAVRPWLNLGYTQQNILPASMGAKMVFASGYEEGIPTISKLGTKIQILGEKGRALKSSNYSLALGLDSDIYPSSNNPTELHLGAEFWPSEILALRVGLDQSASALEGVSTNLCGGIGLRYRGFEFDYAYHPYTSFAEDITHYFSFSYVGRSKEPLYIYVDDPIDKTITRARELSVKGRVEGVKRNKLESLTLNGEKIVFDNEGAFVKEVGLNPGKNLIKIIAERTDGVVVTKNLRILRKNFFVDVENEAIAKEEIECFGTLGLIEGYPDGEFKPHNILSRAELTTLLVRTTNLTIPLVYGHVFNDCPGGYWANKYLKVAKDYYLVQGYPDGSFKPENQISRIEGTVVVTRFDNNIAYPEDLLGNIYNDISPSHWASQNIAAAGEAGMLDFIQSDSLNGEDSLSRAQFVSMLAKTGIGRQLITRLLDFETGYETPDETIVYIPTKVIKPKVATRP